MKGRLSGWNAGHASDRDGPECPPGPRWLVVGDQVAVDDVRQSSLQQPDRFFARFAFGEFPFVEDASFGVRVAQLGDRDQVQRMVQHPVASRVEPMRLLVPEDASIGALELGGVLMPRREPGDDVYGHLFEGRDREAAGALEEARTRTLANSPRPLDGPKVISLDP